jgi:transcription antitermination factor NusG
MDFLADGDRWYALQVRTRREGSIEALLLNKGYRTFLPTWTIHRHLGGGVKQVNSPLFPGYIFCQFDARDRLPILVTPGVLSVVGRGRVPVPVEDSEISAVEAMVASGLPTEPCPFLEVGQRVRIEDGALCGLEGILTSFRGRQKIVVSVTLLKRSVALEIDRFRVSSVRTDNANVFDSRVVRPLLERAVG